MKNRIYFIVLALLFVINITALATISYHRWLRPEPTPVEQGQSETWQTLQQQVSLTPQQSQTMQNLRLSFENEVGALRQQMWEKRDALLVEARAPSPNLKRIDSLIEEIGALQTDIQKKSVRSLLKDKRILTPRQQKKYFSLFEEHTQVRGRRYRQRGKGMQGPGWWREDQK